MAFLSLSEIVKKPVTDIHGEKVGKLADVIVSGDAPYPKKQGKDCENVW